MDIFEEQLKSLPKVLAWPLALVNCTRDPLSRFYHLVQAYEETTRYLTLVHMARYLELRPERPDADVDASLQGLRRPTFGMLLHALAALDSYLARQERPLFGKTLRAATGSEAMQDAYHHISGQRPGTVSVLSLLGKVVQLRNETKGHGNITEPRKARRHSGLLGQALADILSTYPDLTRRVPVLIHDIRYRGPQRHLVEYLRLTGTSLATLQDLEVKHPGALLPDYMYLWDPQGDAPVLLTPLMHHEKRGAQDIIYLFNRVKGDAPDYLSNQQDRLSHRPDNLIHTFKERAGFLLGEPEAVPTTSRPASACEAYGQMVQQAMADGVVEDVEWKMLEATQSALGITSEEARQIHEEHGFTAVGTVPVELGNVKPAEDPPSRTAQPLPVDRQQRHALAGKMDQQDDLDGAMEIYRGLLADDPADGPARAQLALLLLEVSRPREALQVCQQAAADSASAAVLAAQASAQCELGRPAEALHNARRALELDPACELGYLALSDALDFDGRGAEGEDVIRQGLEVLPQNPRLLAISYGQQGNASASSRLVYEMGQLFREHPRDRLIQFLYAMTLNDEDLLRDADRQLNDLGQRNYRSHLVLGIHALVKWQLGDMERARELVQAALELFDSSFYASYVSGLLLITSDSEQAANTFKQALAALPRPMLFRKLGAGGLRLAGKPEDARLELTELLTLQPDYVDARLELSETYEQLGQLEQAEVQVELALQQRPGCRDALLRQAELHLLQGQVDHAQRILSGLHQDSSVRQLHGRVYLARQEYGQAEELYRGLLEKVPGHRGAMECLVLSLVGQGKAEEAEQVCAQAPYWGEPTLVYVAQCWAGKGDHARAKALVEQVADREDLEWDEAADAAEMAGLPQLRQRFALEGVQRYPGSPVMHYQLGAAHHVAGRLPEALSEYERALELDPDHLLAINNRAVIMFWDGHTEQALDSLKRAVSTEAGMTNLRLITNLAVLLINDGQLEPGLARVRDALALDSDESIFVEVVEALIAVDAAQQALALAVEGLEHNPDSLELTRWKARGLCECDQLDAGMALLKEAALANPTQPCLLHDLGIYMETAGKETRALALFRQAHRLAPDNQPIALNLAHKLMLRGSVQEADQIFAGLQPDAADPGALYDHWLSPFHPQEQFEAGLGKALELSERFGAHPMLRGHEGVFLRHLGRAEEAQQPLSDAFDDDPVRWGWGLSKCLWQLDQQERAVDTLFQVLEQAPGEVEDRRQLIRYLVQWGKQDWAAEQLEQLERVAPEDPELDELRALVKAPPKVLN